MNIEDGRCAVDGKKLGFFDKHEHFNTGERVPYEANAPRPYFCSDRCLYWAGKTQVKNLSPREPLTFDEWDESSTEVYVVDGVVQKHRSYWDYVEYFESWQKRSAAYHLEAMRTNLLKFRDDWRTQRADAEAARVCQEQEALQKELAAEEEGRARVEREELLQQETAAMHAEQALSLPYSIRYEGLSITGPTGAGKTHLTQELILRDLEQQNPPGMIVMDPKGLMVKRLARLDYFNPDNGHLNHRLVIVDAAEKPYPALNLFADTARTRQQRDILFSQAISTFRYIFSSGGFKLTSKQANCFGYCVALMFEMKGTLSDIQALLRKGGERDPRVQAAIRRLPDAQRAFFNRDFSESSYGQTRDEIITRLNELTLMPAFVGMFDQAERKIDMLDCIQKRKIVLVNTGMNQNRLVSQMLGRLVISMLLNATYMRGLLPESQWHPVMFYCDEFLEFADSEKAPELLRFVREYNVGVNIAFHNVFADEMTDALRSAISMNTRTKFAYGPKGRDLPYLSSDFGCRPEFFAQYPKTDDFARFICTVSGKIPPTPVMVPWLNVESEPQMTDEQARWVWGYGKQQMAPTPALPVAKAEEDNDPLMWGESDGDFADWPEGGDPWHEEHRNDPHIIGRADLGIIRRAEKDEDDPDYFPRA